MPSDAEKWMRIDDIFRQLLERGIDYFVIPKDMADIRERVKLVEKLISASQEQVS